MIPFKHLRLAFALCAWIGALTLIAPAPAFARNRKADNLVKQGLDAEAKQDYDKALDFYNQAVALVPGDIGYSLFQRRTRFQAGQMHVDAGQKLRMEGKFEEALKEFQIAVLRDPASQIAMQEIRRTVDAIEADKKLPAVERGVTPVDRAKQEAEARVSSMMAPPDLKPISPQIQSLKMNNQPVKVLYETVGKLAGINVVFDSQYQPQGRNYNLDVANTTLEEALDYLGIVTKTFWKPISSNTIFVTDDNVTKRRDYEDEVVRVFYVTNATSVQEFQEVATAIRSVIEVRRVFTYNAQKALVIRGTRDQIALAEKMIADLDRPKSEVVVDVIVMETNTKIARNLAAAIANGTTFGLSQPIAYVPQNPASGGTAPAAGGATAASTAINLAQIGKTSIHDFQTTLPGAFLQAVLSDRGTKVLQEPQVRTSDGMKVSLRIGDKIPYATGSFQPGVGSVGVSPLVSTQFSFAEVGVNVDMTPQVHSAQEVTLHVEIEVSTVNDHVTIGDISQPVIGQRKNTADIRLRNGEMTLLGGLSSSTDTKTLNGIPWLVNLPLLGKLFGGEAITKDHTDLLIALIPHIVRTPDYSPENLRGVYAGTDQLVRVNYAPKKESSVAGPAGTPGSGAPIVTPPPSTELPAAPAKPDVPPGSPVVRFTPATAQVSLSGALTATISIDDVKDLFSAAPIRVKWDPTKLRLSDITPGDLLSRDGLRVTSVKDIRNGTGEATLTISRLPGAGGVKGSGTLATLTFMAIGKGDCKVTVTELGLKNIQLQPVIAAAPELDVKVQ